MIIFLNGSSSAGKSSIARELLEMADQPYIHFSFDFFLEMASQKFLQQEGIVLSGTPIVDIVPSAPQPVFYDQLVTGFHHCLATLAESGLNIVADHVLDKEPWVMECGQLLQPFEVFFVAVDCSLEVLRERERLRGDRPLGLADIQSQVVHLNKQYDVRVASDQLTPQQCASKIWQEFTSGKPFNGFRETVRLSGIDV